jgi:hypothetical protein
MLEQKMQSFATGIMIHKWFRGHGWFEGEILSFDGTYYTIQYADGDKEDCDEAEVAELLTRARFRPTKYAIGTAVQKFFPGHGWFRGYISDFNGIYFTVYYEDGDEEQYEETEIDHLLYLASTRKPPKYPLGSPVKTASPELGTFAYGKVTNFNGISYTVLYRDGYQEQYDEAGLVKILLEDPLVKEEPCKGGDTDVSNSIMILPPKQSRVEL